MQHFNANGDAGKVVRQHKLISTFLLGLLVCAFTTNVSAQVNLVINGDFEDPILTNDPGWMTFYGQNVNLNDILLECDQIPNTPSDSPANCNDTMQVPGWSVIWTDTGEPGRVEIQRGNIAGILPFFGNQKAELDSHHRIGNNKGNNNVTIFQDIPTCVGGIYELRYAWAPRTDVVNDNAMAARIDNVTRAVHNSTSDLVGWQTGVFEFTASDVNTQIEFRSYGTNTTLGVFVDDISVIELRSCAPPPPPECPSEEDLCFDEFGNQLEPPSSLTLSYDRNADSSHNQGDQVSTVPLDPFFPAEVYFEVYDHDGTLLGTSLSLAQGDEYTVTSELSINGKLNPELRVEIWAVGGGLVQTVEFHTSCSLPLAVLDEFGAITIEGL